MPTRNAGQIPLIKSQQRNAIGIDMKISIDGITWNQRYQVEGLLKAMEDAGINETPVWVAFHCDPGFRPRIHVDGFLDDVDAEPDSSGSARKEVRSVPGFGETIVFHSNGSTH